MPPRVKRVVTRLVIKMHNVLEDWSVVIEMQYSLGSLWIHHELRNHCAFIKQALRSINSQERGGLGEWAFQTLAHGEV